MTLMPAKDMLLVTHIIMEADLWSQALLKEDEFIGHIDVNVKLLAN